MSLREQYKPGKATGAEVRQQGEHWALVLARELSHSPQAVWQALTDPAQLREWAPFDADRSLASVGPVKLTTVGAPTAEIAETRVTRADAPWLLEYGWGGSELRWQLESCGAGTRLTLTHNIDRRYVSLAAAGWHICLDVLDRWVAGAPLGRIVGGEAMQFEWPRLNKEYAAQLGVEPLAPPQG